MAPRQAFPAPGRVALLTCLAALVLVVSACKENLSAPPTGAGPDTSGPVMQLLPSQDTLADSTGVLLVRLIATDVSGIKRVELFLLPATSTFAPIMPFDTAFDAFYPVPLAQFKHGTLRFYARGLDLLDHETVTDTVTVTVR